MESDTWNPYLKKMISDI